MSNSTCYHPQPDRLITLGKYLIPGPTVVLNGCTYWHELMMDGYLTFTLQLAAGEQSVVPFSGQGLGRDYLITSRFCFSVGTMALIEPSSEI